MARGSAGPDAGVASEVTAVLSTRSVDVRVLVGWVAKGCPYAEDEDNSDVGAGQQ